MIGVDYGERRIGIAVSEGRLAVPLVIIEHDSRDGDLNRVALIATEQEAQTIVIGLPLSMSGEEGQQARRARRFGDAIARRVDIPVVYHDERLSSVQAAGGAGGRIERAPSGSAQGRRARPRTDDLAAAVILQAYIDATEAGV